MGHAAESGCRRFAIVRRRGRASAEGLDASDPGFQCQALEQLKVTGVGCREDQTMLTGDRRNLTVNKLRCPANGRKSSTLLSMPLGLFPAIFQDGKAH